MALALEKSDNPFFDDLLGLMRTEEFRKFYKEHMNSALDFKTSLVYIELYQTIESIYRRYTGEEITAQDMQMLLKECMRRKEYRAPFARLVREYAVGNLERGALDARMADVLLQRNGDLKRLLDDAGHVTGEVLRVSTKAKKM